MQTGKFAVYKGKEYSASRDGDKHVELYSDDPADEKNGFKKKHPLFRHYSKRVKISEVSEFYEIEAVCDYMGKTHKIWLSSDGEHFLIFVKDSWYKEFGFTEEYDMTYTNRLLGYKKEFKVSESNVRFVKKDLLISS